MAGIVYYYTICASGVLGGIYGCYKGGNIVDKTCPTPQEQFQYGNILAAALSSLVGCGLGGSAGLLIGALSPFLATGLLASKLKQLE